MTNERISEIRARCEAATPGPWRLPLYGPTVMDDSGTPILNVVGHGEQENADMRFITNARTDIPALLAYIKELEAQLAEAKAERDAAVEFITKHSHNSLSCKNLKTPEGRPGGACLNSTGGGCSYCGNYEYRGRKGNG